MKLNVDLPNIPEEIPAVESGQYIGTIDTIELLEPSGKQLKRWSVTITISEGNNKGRKVFDNFPLEYLADLKHPVTVRFGHFVRSTGQTLSPELDTDELVGKSVQFTVIQRSYTEKDTGKQKTAANVKDYLYQKKFF